MTYTTDSAGKTTTPAETTAPLALENFIYAAINTAADLATEDVTLLQVLGAPQDVIEARVAQVITETAQHAAAEFRKALEAGEAVL